MNVAITLLVGALAIHHASGHGQMYNPTPWQATSDCSSPNPTECHYDLKIPTNCTGFCHTNADQSLNIGPDAFNTNWTFTPYLEPTLEPAHMFDDWLDEGRWRTWLGEGVFALNPWNSPGSAPVFGNGCGVNGGNPYGCLKGGSRRRGEVLGQCCGKPGTGDCGGYSKGKPAIEHYQDNLFGTPAVTTWKRGQDAEVYWTSNGYHRGGYAYRLCKVPKGQFWKVTEECFQKGHLNFSGKTSWLSWKPWISKPEYFQWSFIPMDLITTRIGTTPKGSEWAKINIPKDLDTGDWWAFKDLVEVPGSLARGDYVLSFRWDCLESPQIWNACANIRIE